MRVIVLGGTGFVGRHVALALADAGHEAIVVARNPPTDTRVAFRRADATRPRALEAALAGADAVVSTAGSLRQSRGQTFHDIHVVAVRHLVAACRATRVRRVVHLSSLGARAASRSAFHRAKWAGEELVRRSLLDATVLRPSAIFGPGDDFVGPLARFFLRMPIAPMPGRGEARLAPIAVADVARACVAAVERGDTIGAAYDLPGAETISIAEAYDRVMAALGLHRPKVAVPYAVIEPLNHLFHVATRRLPFTFDQLAILEEERAGDPSEAQRALGLSLAPFSVDAIRRILD